MTGHRLAAAGFGALDFRRRGKGCTHSVSGGSLPFVTWKLSRAWGCECGHMSNTKWNLLVWGLEGLAGRRKEGKGGLGFPGHGDSRECQHRFFSPCLFRTDFFSAALTPPPHPLLSSRPAPFPSRGGPGRTSPIVSRWASAGSVGRAARGSWRLLLALNKWWLIEKAPKGGSREQLCWRNGPTQVPATNLHMCGAEAAEASPTMVAPISTSFVSLAWYSPAGPRFPGLEMDQWAACVPCERTPTLGARCPHVVYLWTCIFASVT